jgi:hypothetical protein
MGILGLFFFFFLFILFLGISIVGSVLRSVFGFGRKSHQAHRQTYSKEEPTADRQENDGQEEYSSTSKKRKKIYTKEDGEYVDYEEVKDD